MPPRPPAAPLRGAQISLRFDVPPLHVADYIQQAVSQLHLDFWGSTEGKGRAAAVRRRLGREWRVQARGEYLIGTRREVLSRWRRLPLPRYRIVKGADWRDCPHCGLRRFAVLFCNFRIRATGQRLRLMENHSPASVQDGTGWSRDFTRVRPYRRGQSQWGKWIRRPSRDVVQVTMFDSNLDQHAETWRSYLERVQGLRSIYHGRQPLGGTHGHRLIDTAQSNRRTSSPIPVTITTRDPGLDHGLVWFLLHPDTPA